MRPSAKKNALEPRRSVNQRKKEVGLSIAEPSSLPSLGPLVRFHRKKAKLTQQELAQLAGLGKTVIFDMEKGKESVQLNTLLKVFRILNIQIQFQGPLMEAFMRETNEES